MNATVHTAYILDQHRAAQLDREIALRNLQAARVAADAPTSRPTGFAVVTEWFGKALHVSALRTASAH